MCVLPRGSVSFVKFMAEDFAQKTRSSQLVVVDPEEARLIGLLESFKDEKAKLSTALAKVDMSIQLTSAQLARRRNEMNSRTMSLPPELLGKIFEMAQTYNRLGAVAALTWRTTTSRSPPAEIVLSRVSSHWRSVAIGVSALWTNIHIFVRPRRFAHMYLQRSATRPLCVTLDLHDLGNFKFRLPLLWSRAVEHVSRWRRLSVDAGSMHAMHQALQCLEHHSAPLLEDLEFHLWHNFGAPDLVSQTLHYDILRGGAPRLTTLLYDALQQPRHWPPVSSMVTLYIHNIDESWQFDTIFRRLVADAGCLTNLSINRDCFDASVRSSTPLVIPSLRTLRLRYHPNDGSYEKIFTGIAAPSLEALHLVGAIDFDVFLLADLGVHLYPELKSLVIDNCYLTESTFELLPKAFPSIKHLTCVQAIRPTIEMLEGASYFWPGLTSVYLTEDPNHTSVSPSGIRQLLQMDLGSFGIRQLFGEPPLPPDEGPSRPQLFFAETASFNMSRDLEFMHFPFDFPGWQAI